MTGLFIAPDGSGDLTLWQEIPDRPDYPLALVRKGDLPHSGREVVWALIEGAVQ